MKVAGKTVYGGFYIGGRGTSISVNAAEKTVPAGSGYIEFTVKNNGTEPVRLTSAYIAKGGKKISDVPLDNSLILSGAEKNLAAALDRNLAPGKYSINVPCGKKTAKISFTVKKVNDDALTFFGGKCTAKLSDGELIITVKNNKYTKETLKTEYSDIGAPEVFIGGKWTKTQWMNRSGDIHTDIPYGSSVSLTFGDGYTARYDYIMNDPDNLALLKEMYDEFMEKIKTGYSESYGISREEFEKFSSMSFEDFVKYLVYGDIELSDPPKNSLYCLKIGGEYVYFIV